MPVTTSTGSRVLDYRTPPAGQRVDHLAPGTRSTVEMLKFFAGAGVGVVIIYIRLQGWGLLNESLVMCLLLLMAAGLHLPVFHFLRTFGVRVDGVGSGLATLSAGLPLAPGAVGNMNLRG